MSTTHKETTYHFTLSGEDCDAVDIEAFLNAFPEDANFNIEYFRVETEVYPEGTET